MSRVETLKKLNNFFGEMAKEKKRQKQEEEDEREVMNLVMPILANQELTTNLKEMIKELVPLKEKVL